MTLEMFLDENGARECIDENQETKARMLYQYKDTRDKQDGDSDQYTLIEEVGDKELTDELKKYAEEH